MMTVTEAVATYRKSATAMRNLNGRTGATTKARTWHQSAVDHADSVLRDLGQHTLRGLLTEEDGLAWRLKGLPRDERPELRSRLRTVRAQIQSAVRVAQHDRVVGMARDRRMKARTSG
jgi:hypothetical protein